MGTSVLDVVQHYQRSIERSQEDEKRLLHCIEKLYKLPVKMEHLQDTGVGKTVNSLRKFNGEIGVAAKALVTKWKSMVAAAEYINIPSANNEINTIQSNERHHIEDSHFDQSRTSDVNNQKQISSETQYDDKPMKHYSSKEHKHHRDSKKNGSSKSHHSSSLSKEELDHHKEDSHRHEHDDNKEHKYHSNNKEKSNKRDSTSLHGLHGTSGKSSSHKRIKDEHYENREHQTESEKATDINAAREEKSSRKSSKEINKHENKKSKDESHKKRSHLFKDKEHHSDKKKSSTNPELAPAEQVAEEKVSSSKSSDRKRLHDTDEFKSPSSKKSKKVKMTNEDEADDGIDSTMGANFDDVLGMLNMPTKKSKKSLVLNGLKSSRASITSTTSSTSTTLSSPNKVNNIMNNASKESGSSRISENNVILASHQSTSKKSSETVGLDLLSSYTKLAPLDPSIVRDLPTISNNYKPMPLNQTVMDCVFNASNAKPPPRMLTDDEALHHGISSKTIRTKIYSGTRTGQIYKASSLFDLCIRVLQKNIDALEYTGGVPFEVLRPVLERATPTQLFNFEDYNPYLMEDSDVLWQLHVQRTYRTQKRQELESWREMFLRCKENEERKLNILAQSIKHSQRAIAAPVRKTQLAFVDTMVKPPRNVMRKQEQFGTKSKVIATPASRVAALSNVTPNAVKLGDVRLRVDPTVRDNAQVSSHGIRPKKAPLMAKTLQFMRGRHKR